jgi:hypothetical protein
LRHIPKTEALLDQKIASLSPEDGWWLDILKRGRLPHFTEDARSGVCPGQMLYDDYILHAQKQGARRRQIETAIGIFLNQTVSGLTSSENVNTPIYLTDLQTFRLKRENNKGRGQKKGVFRRFVAFCPK